MWNFIWKILRKIQSFLRNATLVKFKKALNDRLNWAELKLIAMIIFLPILGTLLTESGLNEYKMNILNVYNKIYNKIPSKKYKTNLFLFQLKSIYVAISDCSRDCIIKVNTLNDDGDNNGASGCDDDIDGDDIDSDDKNDDDDDIDDDIGDDIDNDDIDNDDKNYENDDDIDDDIYDD